MSELFSFAELAAAPTPMMDVLALALAAEFRDVDAAGAYVEVARRAGISLHGVGLPGRFVVGDFGGGPPLLLDPFAGGRPIEAEVPNHLVRPWRAHDIAMRMLNKLVAAFSRRGDLGAAIRAAEMRLMLPADNDALRDTLQTELRALRARLN